MKICKQQIVEVKTTIGNKVVEVIGDVEDFISNPNPNGLLLSNELYPDGPALYLRNQINDKEFD